MWTRAELKEKGKAAFKANYWKAVLAGLVMMLVLGTLSISFSSSDSPLALLNDRNTATGHDASEWDLNVDEDTYVSFGEDGIFVIDKDGDTVVLHEGEIYVDSDGNKVLLDDEGIHVNGGEYAFDIDGEFEDMGNRAPSLGQVIALLLLGLLVFLVTLAIVLSIEAFLINPLEVGVCRFFVSNLNRQAEVKEMAYAYDHNYLNGVKTMILRDIFIMLWTLLFIIPGIVKSYEYRMIPYLLSENPEMDYKTAFAESKRMMTGQKWNTFVLDLSFLGWIILSALTLGILGLLYVAPYIGSTNAALYERLRYGNGQPEAAFQPMNNAGANPAAAAPMQATYGAPVQAAYAIPGQPVAPAAPSAPVAPVQTAAPIAPSAAVTPGQVAAPTVPSIPGAPAQTTSPDQPQA